MFRKEWIAVVFLSLSANVFAESYFTEIVVFGDSLLDSGNFGNDRRATNLLRDGSGDYALISPQIFAEALKLDLEPAIEDGGTNFAVGGYQTADVLNSISGTGVDTEPFGGVSTAFLTQRANFVESRALVLINAGGNDLNAIFTSVAPAAVSGAVRERAGNMTLAVQALHDAGARYIMLANVPDLSLVPSVQASIAAGVLDPSFAASISQATTGYNGLLESIPIYSVPAANVIPVDLYGAVNYMLDNAGSYGVANGVMMGLDQRFMCYDGTSPTCVEHPIYGLNGSASDPRKLIFNDALHPTEFGSEIVADYLIDIVSAPSQIGLLPELAFQAADAQTQVIDLQLRQSRWESAQSKLFISASVGNAEYSGLQMADTDSHGWHIGKTFRMSDTTTLGIVAALGSQDLNLEKIQFSSDFWGISGLLSTHRDNLFLQAQVGFSVMSFDDVRRQVPLGAQTLIAQGSTDGYAVNVKLLSGIDLLSSDIWHFGPAIGAQFSRSVVRGYTEQGGQISNYMWDTQTRDRSNMQLGLIASGDIGDHWRVFAKVFAGEDISDSESFINVKSAQSGSASGFYTMPAFVRDTSASVSASLGGSLTINDLGVLDLGYFYNDAGEGQDHVALSFAIPL